MQWMRENLDLLRKSWIKMSFKGRHDIVIRMDHQRTPRRAAALHWEVPGFKRGPGRPRTNWRSTVNLLKMGITWEEAEVTAQNRSEWRRRVAQCIHLDAG